MSIGSPCFFLKTSSLYVEVPWCRVFFMEMDGNGWKWMEIAKRNHFCFISNKVLREKSCMLQPAANPKNWNFLPRNAAFLTRLTRESKYALSDSCNLKSGKLMLHMFGFNISWSLLQTEIVLSAWKLRPSTGSPKPDEVPRARATTKRALITMIFESWLFLAFFTVVLMFSV